MYVSDVVDAPGGGRLGIWLVGCVWVMEFRRMKWKELAPSPGRGIPYRDFVTLSAGLVRPARRLASLRQV